METTAPIADPPDRRARCQGRQRWRPTVRQRPAACRGRADHQLDKLEMTVWTSTTASHSGRPRHNLRVPANAVTALIGPSGCGKSTILRCFNRMNDLIPSARVEGRVLLDGEDINAPDVQPVEVRRRVGLVFQRPNPFPMSIYENVAYGPRRQGVKDGRPWTRSSSEPAPGRHLGRGQGRVPQEVGAVAVGRAAAAPVHRADAGDGPRGDPDGRAVLRARSDRDPADRGADGRAASRTTRSSS